MKSLVLIFYLLPVAVVSAADNIGKTYHVYHKLGNNDEMKPRGTIQIAPDEDSVLVATLHSDKSAQLDTTAFDNMVESNGLYTVIALEEGDNKKPSKFNTQKYISASVPGCSLRRANLREEISLSISPTGKLLSVSYRPLISPLAPKTCKQLPTLSDKPSSIFSRETNEENMPFKTTVSFDSHNPMMEIPTILPNSRPPPGKSEFVLFCCVLWCVQYEDSAIRILHLNLVLSLCDCLCKPRVLTFVAFTSLQLHKL